MSVAAGGGLAENVRFFSRSLHSSQPGVGPHSDTLEGACDADFDVLKDLNERPALALEAAAAYLLLRANRCFALPLASVAGANQRGLRFSSRS